jgi:TetR/AcrR family fatty acid metabolism transcriptional regulator
VSNGEDEGGERLDAESTAEPTADVAVDVMPEGADPSPSDVEAPADSDVGGGPRRARRRAQQRRRILDSAREVFFRDGFVEANLDEVAQGAGVAKGTLYRYFDSKAELYVAVLADNGEIFVEKLRDCIASSADASPPDVIRRVARFYYDHWMSNRDYFQIFWAIENQPVIGALPEGVIEEVARLWEQSLEILAGIVERGVAQGCFRPCDAWEVANILWTLANGVIQTGRSPVYTRLRRRELDLTFTDAVELMIAGLAPSVDPVDRG